MGPLFALLVTMAVVAAICFGLSETYCWWHYNRKWRREGSDLHLPWGYGFGWRK